MAEDHDNGHREGAIEGDLNFPALTPKRSSRITSKKERITPVAASPTRPQKWPFKDRLVLIRRLNKNGTKNIEEIMKHFPNRSKQDIEEFISKEKRAQNLDFVEKPNSSQSMTASVKRVPRRKFDSPIEQWINLSEIAAPNVAVDLTLPDLIEYISEHEGHPDPDKCDGVDYAAIYRALADLMQGEVPASLNAASRTKMLDLKKLLEQTHKQLKDEMALHTRPIKVFTASDASKFETVVQPEPSRAFSFYEDVSVNPFRFPEQMLSKNLVKKPNVT